MIVASVVLDIPTRALDSAFDYEVPEGLGVEVGQCVEVEFSHRPAVGYVMDISERPETGLGDISLLPVKGVLTESYFDEVSSRLSKWMAHEYLSTLPEAVRLFMPPGAAPRFRRLSDGTWEYVAPTVAAVDDRWASLTEMGRVYVPRKNATKQIAVIEALKAGEMRVAELGIDIDSVSTTLRTMEKRGLVKLASRRRMRGAPGADAGGNGAGGEGAGTSAGGTGVYGAASQDLQNLTEGQRQALSSIADARSSGGGVVVLDGVTGSGKTEVYLQAIRKELDAGRSACVLVPEISLTPQTVGRFRSRFGDKVAVLHSRLSAGERYDQWSLIRSGDAKVVVGARSALFAPLRNLGLIVIDEEHEPSYKQGSSPRYSARDVAVKLAGMRGATLVLGSASPSIETLHECSTGNWHRVVLAERASGRPLPPVQVVDLSTEFESGNRSMYSRALADALVDTMDRGEKAVLLLNRRGFASFLMCRECGYVPTCEQCSTSLTFHESTGAGARCGRGVGAGGAGASYGAGAAGSAAAAGGFLMCHHCGRSMPMLVKCPECGSPYIKQLGPGTQFATDQLRSIIGPGPAIVRMDADTTRCKGDHERLLGEFSAADSGVLIGTQMIAKGLDFPDVTLAGVLIADTTLKLPDFRAAERTFQLVEQVAGRAGRADKPGRVVVQTYWPQHPAIVAASRHDRDLFLEDEIPLRKSMGYPPFKRLANILIWGKNEHLVAEEASNLRHQLDEVFGGVPGGNTLFSAAGGERVSRTAGLLASLPEVGDGSLVPKAGVASSLTLSAHTPSSYGNIAPECRGLGATGGFMPEGWSLLGPSPCLLSKLRGTYRWHILVKAPPNADISTALQKAIRQRKPATGVSIAVDVDPMDLF